MEDGYGVVANLELGRPGGLQYKMEGSVRAASRDGLWGNRSITTLGDGRRRSRWGASLTVAQQAVPSTSHSKTKFAFVDDRKQHEARQTDIQTLGE